MPADLVGADRQRLDRACHRGFTEQAGLLDAFAQTHGAAEGINHLKAARPRARHEQAAVVGPEIEGRDGRGPTVRTAGSPRRQCLARLPHFPVHPIRLTERKPCGKRIAGKPGLRIQVIRPVKRGCVGGIEGTNRPVFVWI